MSKNAKKAKPDPAPSFTLGKQEGFPDCLNGANPRGEVAACPTGLIDPEQAQAAQQPGGGGSPGTGAVDPSVPVSPGEGISETQTERTKKQKS